MQRVDERDEDRQVERRRRPRRARCTTRTKKYAVKNEPKSMISEPMKRNIPSMPGVTRDE